MKKDLLVRHPLSENRGAVEGSVSTSAVKVIIVRAKAMKQVGFPVFR